MRKNKNLDEREKKFLESEGIANPEQKKLAEIIRKNKFIFNLDKYTKLREKEKELRTKNQLKRQEMKKKQMAKNQEMGIFEPESPIGITDNQIYDDMIKKSLQNTAFDLKTRFSNQSHQTIKVMNMIKAKVEEDLQKDDEEIEVLSPSSPLRKKIHQLRRDKTFYRQK